MCVKSEYLIVFMYDFERVESRLRSDSKIIEVRQNITELWRVQTLGCELIVEGRWGSKNPK